MADVQFKLTGADQLLQRLRALPKELRLKPARSALGKAARVVREQAAANALRIDDAATGRRIADNMIQRWRSRYHRRTGDMMVSVGVGTEKGRIPKGNPDEGAGGNTPHWHLIELGHAKKGGGLVAPQPFLRPAAQQAGQQAIDVFGAELDKAITRAVDKLK